MSVNSFSIRRLIPLITAVIAIGALVIGATAIMQTRSARASEKTLNSYLAVKESIDRFALLDVQVKFNKLIGQFIPGTKEGQDKLMATDTQEMGEIVNQLDKADLTESEHSAINAIQAARDAYLKLDSEALDISTPEKLAEAGAKYDAATAAQTDATAAAKKLLQASVEVQQTKVHNAVRDLTSLLLGVSIGAGLLIAIGLTLFGRQLVRRISLLDDALGSVSVVTCGSRSTPAGATKWRTWRPG